LSLLARVSTLISTKGWYPAAKGMSARYFGYFYCHRVVGCASFYGGVANRRALSWENSVLTPSEFALLFCNQLGITLQIG